MQVELIDARSLFIVPEGGAYFNCAYKGLTPRAAAEAAALSPTALDCPWAFEQTEALRSALLEVIAEIIGVTSEEIALIPSVSYGMALARSVTKLMPKDQVLILESAHPAAALAWYAECKVSGARILPIKESADDLTEAILSAMDSSVRIVVVPQVHWIDGRPIDLPQISSRAKELGALLITDATQSVGGRPFKIPEFQPDIAIFSGYKWLFGPLGLAYLYVAPAFRNGPPFEHSWVNYAGEGSTMFDAGGRIQYPTEPLPGMRRFEASGLHNALTLRMALTAARLAREVSPERILARNADLISRIGHELPDRLPNIKGDQHFVALRSPDARREAQRLAAHSIYTSARGRYLRISPNIWNNDADLEALVAQLRCPAPHANP
jgi:selenocysteine lyase/cysteine desulfurase